MATSLSQLKSQIAKLQRQADSIQATVIARIKKEIAQHGLTAEDLFESSKVAKPVTNDLAAPAKPKPKANTKGADKPAKFADGQGNTWHGVGLRPKWIHAALNAGHSLNEFLIAREAAPAEPTTKARRMKAAAPVKAVKGRKTAATTAAPAKKVAKKAVAEKPSAKVPAAKTRAVKPKAAPKPAAKAAAKRATVKKAAKTVTAGASAAAGETPDAQA